MRVIRSPSHDHRGGQCIGLVLVLVLMVLGIGYVSSYALLVNRVFASPDDPWSNGNQPTYRCGGSSAERLFQAVHFVDRRLRPEFWDHDNLRIGYRSGEAAYRLRQAIDWQIVDPEWDRAQEEP